MKCLSFFLLVFSVPALKAQDMNTGIIYGKNHAYSLTAPEGWVLDNKSGKSQGLHAVFYPMNSSWAKAPAVMYTNVSALDSSKNEKAEDVIQYDINTFKKHSPKIKIKKKKPIAIDKGERKAQVYYFLGDAQGNYEAVAYIAEEKLVVMIVITSNTEKDFYGSLGKFKELVQSYTWLTGKVEIK